MRRILVGALALSGVLALAACGGDELAEQIVESQDGVGDVEIDEDGGEVSVETEDGSASFGGGEIPDGFPVDLPGGGDVQSVIEQGEDVIVSLVYEDDFSDIAGFFQDWVDSSGHEVVNKIEASNPQSINWALQDDERAYNITVAEAGESIQVSIAAGAG